MTHFIELVKALAWPVAVLIIFCSFRAEINELVRRSSGVRFEALGIKFRLNVQQVHDVAEQLFKEISAGLDALDDDQRKLFAAVKIANDGKTVNQVTQEVFGKPFDRNSDEHDQFRALRDFQLIRPREGGRWKAERHPVITPYAQIILKAAPNILERAKVSNSASSVPAAA